MNIKADIYSKRQKQKTGKTLTLAVSTDNSLSHLLNVKLMARWWKTRFDI